MYTSDIRTGEGVRGLQQPPVTEAQEYGPKEIKTETNCLRISLNYLCVSIFCAFFGAVYEHFSHEVYSYYMLYAFAFPLIGGALVYLILVIRRAKAPCRLAQNLYHSGITALTVGSIFTGVLEIYGTTNQLVRVYWIVGVALTGAGIIAAIVKKLS